MFNREELVQYKQDIEGSIMALRENTLELSPEDADLVVSQLQVLEVLFSVVQARVLLYSEGSAF